MITILKPDKWVLDFYPEEESNNIKLSNYAVISEYNEGFLLFHTISWSLYYLTKEEYDNILSNQSFKKVKVIVSDNVNESEIAEKVYAKRSTYETSVKRKDFNSFVILTTTDCNARCPYCYEKGINKIKMTLKTAEDTVQFIKKNYNRKMADIEWFGGEPLYNSEIIDYISTRLKEEEINYSSSIITNGYLLNKENIDKMGTIWNTKTIQITIDGPSEQYKKIKNFIYEDENPYQTVIKNIINVVNKTNVKVAIRINVSYSNLENIKNLLLDLRNKFLIYIIQDKISIYLALIYQEIMKVSKSFISYNDKKYKLLKIYEEFDDILNYNAKFLPQNDLSKKPMQNCMADGGSGIVINSDGRLSNCEHWDDSHAFGDVISGITNYEFIESLIEGKKSNANLKTCRELNCQILPICSHYFYCPVSVTCENENMKNGTIYFIKKKMVAEFDNYLKKKKEEYQN